MTIIKKRTLIMCVSFTFACSVIFGNTTICNAASYHSFNHDLIVRSNFNYNSMSKKAKEVIDAEAKNNTTDLKTEIEKKFNYAGVLDEEIQGLDAKTISEFNKADVISVSTGITEEVVKEGESTMQNANVDEMSSYYAEHNKKVVQTCTDSTKKRGKKIYKDSDTATTSGGKFKHTLFACNTTVNGEKGMYYTYQAKWLKTPVNNEIDTIELSLGNCTILKKYNTFFGCTDSYTRSGNRYVKTEEFSKKKDVIKNACAGQTAIRVITFDLPGNKYGRKEKMEDYYYFKDTCITVTGYSHISNLTTKPIRFSVDAFYKHCEVSKTYNLNPSIGIDGSISYGISSNQSKHYNALTNGLNVVIDVDMTK